MEKFADGSMYSFTLKTKDWSREERFNLISDIYFSFLYNDDYWHFFFEDEIGEFLRVSKEFSEDVENYLQDREIEYELVQYWYEDLGFVRNNQDYFRDIFHLNSILAVRYEGNLEDLELLLSHYIDRYSHSLHDMLHLRIGNNLMKKEARNLSSAALGRAWFDGYRDYYLQSRKRNESNV